MKEREKRERKREKLIYARNIFGSLPPAPSNSFAHEKSTQITVLRVTATLNAPAITNSTEYVTSGVDWNNDGMLFFTDNVSPRANSTNYKRGEKGEGR